MERLPVSPETLAAQGFGEADPVSGGLAPVITPATNYERQPDGSYRQGRVYTRADNPTYELAEGLLAALEGADCACVLFASGMAAATAVFQSLLPGDHVLVSRVLYWGVRKWLAEFALTWGLDVEFTDTTDLSAVAACLRPGRTRLVWVETLPTRCGTSPTWRRSASLRGIAAGAWVAVDNTVATPVLTRPFEHGADLVMHSATKYLNGCDVLAWLRGAFGPQGPVLGADQVLAPQRRCHARAVRSVAAATRDAHTVPARAPGLGDGPGHRHPPGRSPGAGGRPLPGPARPPRPRDRRTPDDRRFRRTPAGAPGSSAPPSPAARSSAGTRRGHPRPSPPTAATAAVRRREPGGASAGARPEPAGHPVRSRRPAIGSAHAPGAALRLPAVEGRAEAAATPGITGLTITIPVGQQVRPLPEGDCYLGFIFAGAIPTTGWRRRSAPPKRGCAW